jgi:hypothetical protein
MNTNNQNQKKEIILQTYPREIWDKCDEIEKVIDCIVNEKFTVPRLGEMMNFIEVRFMNDLNIDKLDSFCVYVGGSMITRILIDLMMKICSVTRTNTQIVVKLQKNMMIKGMHDILLYKLRYHNIELLMLAEENNNYHENYQVIIKYIDIR